MLDDLERFWSKVDKSGGEQACWLWLGARNPNGYGQFRHDGQMRQAHRWILGQTRGAALQWNAALKEEACHHCDNPPCVNPAHLFVGDRSANMRDSADKGRNPHALKTHCPQGHEYSPENTLENRHGRQCRTCSRDRTETRRRERGVTPRESIEPATHCRNGHEYSAQNTYVHAGTGKRYCRTCNAESRRRRQASKD